CLLTWAAILASVAGVAPNTAPAIAADAYTSVSPDRLLDTRNDINNNFGRTGTCFTAGGASSPCIQLGPGETREVQIAGQMGLNGSTPVPPGADAAVLVVTEADHAGSASFLTVWPSDVPQPTTSNINFVAGQIT